MSIKGKAYIAGIYEHPTRLAKDISLAQIHAQCAKGALEDAGLTKASTCTPCARMRHMHEYGTTSEQLAWIKVAASHHAQHNPHALLRKVVTVEEVVNSPMISDPLHRLDCCVITDGGGALIVVRPRSRAS
jgi:acetyl-CoA acetyltransferase